MHKVKLLKIKLLCDLKVARETVQRIGIGNKTRKILFPSCYIMFFEDEYYLVHFKELFAMNGTGYENISDTDINRRNAIAFNLRQWGLIVVDDEEITPHDEFVFVLSHKDKRDWTISHKINIRSFPDEMIRTNK